MSGNHNNEYENADYWLRKGISFAEQGLNEEAIEAFDKALAIDSRCESVWFLKGISLESLGRHEEAIKAHNKVLEIDLGNWKGSGLELSVFVRRAAPSPQSSPLRAVLAG